MSSLKLKFILACSLAGLLAGPVSSLAASTGRLDDLPSRKVKYGDLDLNRDAGVAALYSRIKTAAREVCQPMDIFFLNLVRQQYSCSQGAIARAVADVNAPLLTSYFLEKASASNDR
ncbi:MAG TPA: UrcA family protein [Steroidobacteraceae bacterium]|jgi:UrcA family protein|nr:UrcA family protein [Steroidobacteraceae bacterium]